MSVVGIDQVHQLSYYIAAKQSAAFPSPVEFNSYANLANIDLYNYYNDERDKMLFRVRNGETTYAPPILANFIVPGYNMIFNNGSASLPNDYIFDIALNSSPSGGVIKRVDLDKYADYTKSTIDAPTNNNPIYVELSDSLQVTPRLGNAYLTYYREPKQVLWAYTLVNNRPVYDPANSVQFEWDSTEIMRLTSRVLFYMGVSIRDGELEQAAQQMTQTAS